MKITKETEEQILQLAREQLKTKKFVSVSLIRKQLKVMKTHTAFVFISDTLDRNKIPRHHRKFKNLKDGLTKHEARLVFDHVQTLTQNDFPISVAWLCREVFGNDGDYLKRRVSLFLDRKKIPRLQSVKYGAQVKLLNQCLSFDHEPEALQPTPEPVQIQPVVEPEPVQQQPRQSVWGLLSSLFKVTRPSRA